MPKPADLSVTGLRRRHVLTRARNCQGVGAITPQAHLVVLLGKTKALECERVHRHEYARAGQRWPPSVSLARPRRLMARARASPSPRSSRVARARAEPPTAAGAQ